MSLSIAIIMQNFRLCLKRGQTLGLLNYIAAQLLAIKKGWLRHAEEELTGFALAAFSVSPCLRGLFFCGPSPGAAIWIVERTSQPYSTCRPQSIWLVGFFATCNEEASWLLTIQSPSLRFIVYRTVEALTTFELLSSNSTMSSEVQLHFTMLSFSPAPGVYSDSLFAAGILASKRFKNSDDGSSPSIAMKYAFSLVLSH